MAKKILKIYKTKFNDWHKDFVDLYMELGNSPILDKVMNKYKNFNEVYLENFDKSYKALTETTKHSDNYYLMDNQLFKNYVNSIKAIQKIFKETLSKDDGVMLNTGYVSLIDFVNQYIDYLNQIQK